MSDLRIRLIPGLSLALLVLILDQLSKWWIVERVMAPPQVIEVTSFFNLVMVWNRGVSFGLFDSGGDYSVWILSGLAMVIVMVLAVWMGRSERGGLNLLLGLIIGGAIGNVIDRFRYGAVADFLDVHMGGLHWPAFNVADSAITVGAILLVADSLFGGEESLTNKDETGSDRS
ncbi:signal peptidase II [Magnetospira sp. QH-2]|uniref:signal peptidase II n=1 Tax=Magnetospira sp. (strain QH-2) TaxID=1288970 RepID=UPI0005F9E4F3|nr:signal peptidase II [Magnetospira sp. QH-2]